MWGKYIYIYIYMELSLWYFLTYLLLYERLSVDKYQTKISDKYLISIFNSSDHWNAILSGERPIQFWTCSIRVLLFFVKLKINILCSLSNFQGTTRNFLIRPISLNSNNTITWNSMNKPCFSLHSSYEWRKCQITANTKYVL